MTVPYLYFAVCITLLLVITYSWKQDAKKYKKKAEGWEDKCGMLEHEVGKWEDLAIEWMLKYRSAEQSNKWLNPLMENYQRLLDDSVLLKRHIRAYNKRYNKKVGAIRHLENQLAHNNDQLARLNSEAVRSKIHLRRSESKLNSLKNEMHKLIDMVE